MVTNLPFFMPVLAKAIQFTWDLNEQQEVEKRENMIRNGRKDFDSDYAQMSLSYQEEMSLSIQEEFDQSATSIGKACDFVNKITAYHDQLLISNHYAPRYISPVSPNDMVFLAEQLFTMQESFRQLGKNVHVDIGYHYTKSDCMERIRSNGLLTAAERRAAGINGRSNGATFGDGIYTCRNAFSYKCYGDQGLLVARLQGQIGEHGQASGCVDTIVGRGGRTNATQVLQLSSQCVVLAAFRAELIEWNNDDSLGNEMVHTFHCSLQEIVDECFNCGVKIPVPKLFPSQVKLCGCGLPRSTVIKYTAPEALSCADASNALLGVQGEAVHGEYCSICLARLRNHGPVVSLADCSHQFHQSCIENSMKCARKCPLCRAPIGAPQGKMPSGTMQIEVRPDLICSGYPAGTLVITYRIYEGRQKDYHENPGEVHGSARRVAYVPECQEGRNLLQRLQFAFTHGLTFTVGTSLTSSMPNSVTWSSIHHKTSLSEGAHGYPDPGYFINANEDLDALNVPASYDL
jgi:Deltex C-terminal domain/Ring finger domain